MAKGKKGSGINLSNYQSGPRKAMASMKRTYGSNWKKVYYSLANKRAGRGLKGQGRGYRSANTAYAKGSHWPGSVRRSGAGRARVKVL
jgi:hypothetical protein